MRSAVTHILILLSKEKFEEFPQQKIEEWSNQIAPVKGIQKSHVWIHNDKHTYTAQTLRSKKEEISFVEPRSQKRQENIQIHSLQKRMFVACIIRMIVNGGFQRL